MNNINILGVPFCSVKQSEASELIFTACRHKQDIPFTIVTPNPIMVMNAQENESLLSALSSADLVLADGIGIISAAKRMETPLPERVTGIDTAYSVIEKLDEIGGSLYLLGAKPGIAEKAAQNLSKSFPSLKIVGTLHGYFDDDTEIIKDIAGKSPDLLAVCLGSPRQEIWVHQNKEKLSGVGAIMCLGGSLDVWAENVKRAPKIFIKLHLEWLFRMLNEPKRFKELPKMIKFRILTRKTRQKDENVK